MVNDCDCPYCSINIASEKLGKGVWVSEIQQMPFVYGWGPTKKMAEEAVMDFHEAALEGWN